MQINLIRVIDQHALGNFENEPRRSYATFRQRRADHFDDGPIAHLEWRKIHRDIEIVGSPTGILQDQPESCRDPSGRRRR